MRAAVALLFSLVLFAQDVRYPPKNDQIPGPPTPADWAAWLDDVRHWRDEKRIRIGYSGKEYDRPEYAQWLKEFPHTQSLEAKGQVEMFRIWDQQVGAAKTK